MHHCPECQHEGLSCHVNAPGERFYTCQRCGSVTRTVEVPDDELKRLFRKELELDRLKTKYPALVI